MLASLVHWHARTSSICMDSFRPHSLNGVEDVAEDKAAFRWDMQLFTADHNVVTRLVEVRLPLKK